MFHWKFDGTSLLKCLHSLLLFVSVLAKKPSLMLICMHLMQCWYFPSQKCTFVHFWHTHSKHVLVGTKWYFWAGFLMFHSKKERCNYQLGYLHRSMACILLPFLIFITVTFFFFKLSIYCTQFIFHKNTAWHELSITNTKSINNDLPPTSKTKGKKKKKKTIKGTYGEG